MQWKMKTKGFLAIILSLMILASGLPARASLEPYMADSPDAWIEYPMDGTEPVVNLEDEPSSYVEEIETPPDDSAMRARSFRSR